MIRILFWAAVLFAAPLAAQPVSQSDKPLNNAESTFRFAIMSDRTGGMLPGVFEKGVEKVNLMQPEFVLSVGDLVDGYTTDPDVWNAQWDEFDAIVDRLDMRFYYVPGNHDISNPQLDAVWRERHGSPWYTFRYKDVLFVALHTEDRPGGGIGPRQLADITAALEADKDARWTLLFMHRPLWSYGHKAGYEAIEAALGDRDYTLFSGHHHHYLYSRHNGRDHYVLATTGGGSHLRGVEFGEFEHITWVTMSDRGPQVAHVELDGIHGKEIVTDRNNRMIQALRMGRWMSAEPIFSETATFTSASTVVRFSHSESSSMRVSGRLEPAHGVVFDPAVVDLTVPPDSTVTISLTLRSDSPVSVEELNNAGISLTLSATYTDRGRPLSLPSTIPLRLDALRTVGDTVTITRPVFLQEDWDLKGPEDGRFTVHTEIDRTHLHVHITAWDDRVILPSPESPDAHHDQVYVHFQTVSGEILRLRTAPAALSDVVDGRFTSRVSIPLDLVPSERFRLNVGWMDHDRPENTKPSVLWLHPVWGSEPDWDRTGYWVR